MLYEHFTSTILRMRYEKCEWVYVATLLDQSDSSHVTKYSISIGYTMEKCAYVTHEFAVFLEAKPSEKTSKLVGYRGAYTTRFHGVTDLYYTTHAL